ncbi:Endonuclease/exonuclease/phosphatase [Gossypium australe]|uniref:Endonuclease/exonuclease/phosphatase n=1 Tax=Gossypium australe TaxID=47621 RepID=A0A5B6UG11_9ROSI|nr:Endonuclease/exonuclease/phosphatase [Gossypium australe]
MLAIRRLTFLLLIQGFSYGIPVFTKMFQGSLSIEEDELDLDSNLEDGDFGFYTVKFINPKDRLKVVTEGPWKIMDHYLTIQKWKPNFHIERAKVKSTAIWIHLLGLPLEYFHKSILVSIWKLVGKPIKLDTNTALAMRGKCFNRWENKNSNPRRDLRDANHFQSLNSLDLDGDQEGQVMSAPIVCVIKVDILSLVHKLRIQNG